MKQPIYLITGVMAAGKSTVAEALAGRLKRGVHLRGDVFRRMIVTGRAEMSENLSDEAVTQLYLRYRLAANAAKIYSESGFSVVLQDNYYGDALPQMLELLEGYPVNTTVLCPDVETVRAREAARQKRGYNGFDVDSLYAGFMKETPRIGFWLDNSVQTPDESAAAILAHFLRN